MEKGNVVTGLLAGIAVGAVLGILFAPEKGIETRKKIAKKGKESLGDLKNKYNDALDKLTSKLDQAKNEGLNIYEDGIELAENSKQ
ncbi:MAG: YtxH domain-containing protein [Flavobacterium sp.]|nr:YtxH domain-containing protein [Flavobacterium sp.]